MKTKYSISVLLAFLFMSFAPSPQKNNASQIKVILKSGDVKEFKTHKTINLKFVYDDLKVGNYNSEQEYTDKKVSDLNKKENGRGDKWVEKWENAKQNVWPKKFEVLYNKVLDKKLGITCDRNSNENEYTLLVSVSFIEPGFNIGIARKNASASFLFNLVKTESPDEPLVQLYLNNVPGASATGTDYDSDSRIAESFAKGGKMLAAYIAKKAK